jgi:ABC-type nitrate/sulfonate/bicarbonate transport system permease component
MTALDTFTAESPPAPADVIVTAPRRGSGGDRGRARYIRLARGALAMLVSAVVVLGAWQLFLVVFHVNHFIGKGPADVFRYLVTSPDAAAHRTAIQHESMTTLRDAILGLVGGTLAAIACAIAFNLSRPIEQTFMPIAMVLRSVPLVAMTPLIVLIFGRDLKTIAVIAGIVTFFPTLVNVALALRWAPKDSMDLCRAYGASPATALWKVQVPSALPALMASLRIAAPLALVGALLSEWLATGKGLGYRILQVGALSDYNGLWSRVALVTLYSFALYRLIGAVEVMVLRRFAPVRD